MKLLTKAIKTKLLANAANEGDHKPVLKLFNPTGAGTWLVSEMDENGNMFCLADLGMGSPELGYSNIHELEEYKGPFGLGIERDYLFKANKTLSEYADEARAAGGIRA
jgi:hypothetical protein